MPPARRSVSVCSCGDGPLLADADVAGAVRAPFGRQHRQILVSRLQRGDFRRLSSITYAPCRKVMAGKKLGDFRFVAALRAVFL